MRQQQEEEMKTNQTNLVRSLKDLDSKQYTLKTEIDKILKELRLKAP